MGRIELPLPGPRPGALPLRDTPEIRIALLIRWIGLPLSGVGANRVTVGADEFAFGQFREYPVPRPSVVDGTADIDHLVGAYVIPLHSDGMKRQPAVGTRLAAFHFPQPHGVATLAIDSDRQVASRVRCPAFFVVFPPARLAPTLVSIPAAVPMEIG